MNPLLNGRSTIMAALRKLRSLRSARPTVTRKENWLSLDHNGVFPRTPMIHAVFAF